ncbi:MAG: hypothetical protein KAJ75_01885 [Alphaproteobacteria bacterium]|nr:hypothetical protein [Alphaproteobacteria bacterium]
MENFDWNDIPEKDSEVFLKKINSKFHRELFDKESSRLRARNLPFYKDYKLLEITEFASHPPLTMDFLFKGDDIEQVDGTKDSILSVSKKADVYLNKKNVTGYVKFILNSMMSEDGRFQVIENIEEMPFSEDPSQELFNELKDLVKPVKTINMTEEGYDIEAYVLYSRTLFKTKLNVTHKGVVDITKEEILKEELPANPIMLL